MSPAQPGRIEPVFARDQRVTVASRASLGHCRTPFYLRGCTGVVVEVIGPFRDPERLAYHKPGLPQCYLYHVRFNQTDLWEVYRGPAADCLDADIFEHWLKPATEETGK